MLHNCQYEFESLYIYIWSKDQIPPLINYLEHFPMTVLEGLTINNDSILQIE